MKLKTFGLDTDCAAAQEAKRLGIAVHDARVQHRRATGWTYNKPATRTLDPHWTYHHTDDVKVTIYDQEDQP